MTAETQPDWRAIFEEVFSTRSAVEERITRDVLGDDYPDELATYSFLSRSDLHRFVDALRVGPGSTLVDVGCGLGAGGLWVAKETGATLLGLDIAERPLVDARASAAALGVAATFRRGEFESTGLPDASVDAAMSVDALPFTPDKAAAFRELRRILRPGTRLGLTSWDYRGTVPGRPPQPSDHRPLAEAAGFRVVRYDDLGVERELEFDRRMLEAAEELAEEAGRSVDDVRAELEGQLARDELMTRRFFLVAEAG